MKIWMFPARSRRTEEGYTLLEVLVVVAILAMVVSAAPALYGRFVPEFQVRQYANAFAVHARELREAARSTGKLQTLSFSPDGKTLLDEDAPKPPPGVELEYQAASLWGYGNGRRLLFFPRGGSSGGVVTVRRHKLTVRLQIDWVSGAIEVVQ